MGAFDELEGHDPKREEEVTAKQPEPQPHQVSEDQPPPSQQGKKVHEGKD